MKAKLGLLLTMVLMMLAAFPHPTLGKHVTAFGSLRISRCTDQPCTSTAALVNEVVVLAVTANPGLEKTISVFVQGPPFAFPVFVNAEKGNPGNGDIDTVIVITDLTGSGLTVILTLVDQSGTAIALNPNSVFIPANGTSAVSVANLLP